MITKHRVSVDGVETSYCENGAGRPIVFLHGAGFRAEAKSSFVRQLNGLSDQFTVVAIDQLHFGGTDYPADCKYINRLGRVNHVISFLQQLGLKQITLVGHSEGSFVDARVAIVRPDLVSKLVLLTANSVSPAFGDDRDEAWLEACRQAYGCSGPMPSEEEYITARRKSCRAHGQDVECAEREAYRRAAARGQWEIWQRLPEDETNLHRYPLLQQKYIFPYLDQLQAQTLIIWSKNDPTATPEQGINLAKLIRNSDFHLLNNAGDSVQVDPERSREQTHPSMARMINCDGNNARASVSEANLSAACRIRRTCALPWQQGHSPGGGAHPTGQGRSHARRGVPQLAIPQLAIVHFQRTTGMTEMCVCTQKSPNFCE